MCDPLGRHHDDFALDQLELLILVDDAGFDHAADVLDGERPTRETFGSCGGGNVHGRLCFHIITIIAHVAPGCDAIANTALPWRSAAASIVRFVSGCNRELHSN